MLDVFSWATSNGHKVHIMLEECALPYTLKPVNIGAGEQFSPQFLALSPNNKIPAIHDNEGPDGEPIVIFESGAILVYLASKTGKFMPSDERGRYQVLQWLMFQMSAVGPMLGQAHHFRKFAPEKLEYAIDRYINEARRIYGVLDRQLQSSPYIATDAYTIADIATLPWIRNGETLGILLAEYPHVMRWFDGVSNRPAVQRGVNMLGELRTPFDNAKAREVLFGHKIAPGT